MEITICIISSYHDNLRVWLGKMNEIPCILPEKQGNF